ncbi:hypothetical protein P7C70_g5315, partial [Phenoliferia sp. Uapishka_3]
MKQTCPVASLTPIHHQDETKVTNYINLKPPSILYPRQRAASGPTSATSTPKLQLTSRAEKPCSTRTRHPLSQFLTIIPVSSRFTLHFLKNTPTSALLCDTDRRSTPPREAHIRRPNDSERLTTKRHFQRRVFGVSAGGLRPQSKRREGQDSIGERRSSATPERTMERGEESNEAQGLTKAGGLRPPVS